MNLYASSTVANPVHRCAAGRAPDKPGYFVAGTGTPVVMLHSSLGSKLQWAPLAERLASKFCVIALDLCGYGDNASPPANRAFTLEDEVRLVAAHIDRLVAPHVRVHMIGHSYGGLVALRFAQGAKGRVRSLSLYEPVVFRLLCEGDATLADLKRLVERIPRLVAAGRRDHAARGFVDFWSGDGSYASLPPPAQASIARRVDKVTLDFQAACGWPLAPGDLRTIVAPTLLLAGKRSPSVAQRMVAKLIPILPNRRVGWLDAGHMGPITDADRVNPWIEAFIDLCGESDVVAAAPHAGVAPTSCSPPVPTCQSSQGVHHVV